MLNIKWKAGKSPAHWSKTQKSPDNGKGDVLIFDLHVVKNKIHVPDDGEGDVEGGHEEVAQGEVGDEEVGNCVQSPD